MRPPAVIIAGGGARRMGGGDKLYLELHGKRLLDHILERLAPQVAGIVINANGDPSRFPLPVIPDSLDGVSGPLAGLHAALRHGGAQGAAAVLTVPGDVPLLPSDLVARLGAEPGAAIAASGGRRHFVIGLWPVSLLPEVEAAAREGIREMHRIANRVGVRVVTWPGEPFHNINTPGDLAALNR